MTLSLGACSHAHGLHDAMPADGDGMITVDDDSVICGALGESCCNETSCDPGAVCSGMTCVSVLAPAACAGSTPVAQFVSEVAPPATLAPWQHFQASVTFANCSGVTWDATAALAPTGYKLGTQSPQDNDIWIGTNRLELPASVPSGMQITVGLPIRAPALTGPRAYAFGIVHENVAWVPAFSPPHVIDVEATAMATMICPGITADIGGVTSASAAIQSCIDQAPAGSVLALPAGIYRITGELHFDKPLTFTTAGTAGAPGCLAFDGPPCVVLRADDNLSVPRGFVVLGATSQVTLDHVVLDGNRDRRTGSAAANQCSMGSNGSGFNARSAGCVGCSFVHSGSARALCGTGFEWIGDQATITDSVFRDNGNHANLWSDGLTLLISNGASITQSKFLDNSDVDLILGGSSAATIQNNLIRQRLQRTFAGLMLDNFNGATPGDYTNTVVSGNTVDCGAQLCDYGIELGPHAWYQSANITGGTVTGNVVRGGSFGINVEGAGTAAAPITITANDVGPSPASAGFNCGTRATTAFNVSPDSVVVLGAGPAPTGAMIQHNCP